ncbi:MAG: tryptophanyl-tRNA synthetase [Candidatus Dependentiae bacterium]|nr:tryptophanyl-tRNA synthetase [Candidatus Dependentiae bacterium]
MILKIGFFATTLPSFTDSYKRLFVMRILSGIQPSGQLHLGNYFGAIYNWVRLQNKGEECFFFLADLHAQTVPYEAATRPGIILELAATLMACGIDPHKSVLFVQSQVPAHTQLSWILSCLAPFGELERMVQFKEKSEAAPHAVNVGLFTYPILQAADVLLYRPDMVPVGIDQAQHLELTRTLAHKFNNRFCPADAPLFKEPKTLHSTTIKVLGLDGQRKMSKSFNNYIGLTEPEDVLWEKLRHAATDPARVKRTDPGNPDICNVFSWHKLFSPIEVQEDRAAGCRSAAIGCIDCKKTLFTHMNALLAPIREKYHVLMQRPDDIRDALEAGAKRARGVADATMETVYKLVGGL